MPKPSMSKQANINSPSNQSAKTDSSEYLEKKSFVDSLITVYGRKPVLEALQDKSLPIYKLHLADSNKRQGIVNEMIALAEARDIEIAWHDRTGLSRISKNGKQDQGVAADLHLPTYQAFEKLLRTKQDFQLIALDSITNPQNVGMIIRSVAASPMTGLLLPKQGCAALSPLVIKASAGALFKSKIFWCQKLTDGLDAAIDNGAVISGLSLQANYTLNQIPQESKRIFVLGNETNGLSKEVENRCQQRLKIPMANGVESLNVAVTAALIAFNAAI